MQQWNGTAPNGDFIGGVERIFDPAPFTMIDGQTTVLTGAFEELVPSPGELDWRRSEFAAQASAMHPLAVPSSYGFSLSALMRPELGFFGDGVVLFYSSTIDGTDATVPIEVGSPFPPPVGTSAVVDAGYSLEIGLPNAEPLQWFIYAAATQVVTSTSIAGAPLVGPVRDFRMPNPSGYTDALTGLISP